MIGGGWFSLMVTERIHVSGNSERRMLRTARERERGGGGETGCAVTTEPRRHCWPPGDSTVLWKHKQNRAAAAATTAGSIHVFLPSHTFYHRLSHYILSKQTLFVCVCLPQNKRISLSMTPNYPTTHLVRASRDFYKRLMGYF